MLHAIQGGSVSSFEAESFGGQRYAMSVEEARQRPEDLVRTLIDIDLQTFAEPTFSPYLAAALLVHGAVYLLRAQDAVIGTCVFARDWERPSEVVMLTMGIRPGWRGRGLGQDFLRQVLTRLAAKGLRSCTVLVGDVNKRAIRVYQDVGFEIADDDAMRDPRSGERYVRLRCVLNSGTPLTALNSRIRDVPVAGPIYADPAPDFEQG